MCNTTCQSELHALLMTGVAGKIGRLGVVREGTAKSITHLIGKSTYTRHAVCMRLHGTKAIVYGRRTGGPSLTVDGDGRVYLVQFLAYEIHCLYVVYSHQVKAETVYVVLFHPIAYALQHELAHQGTLAGSFIATTRSIGIVATRCADIATGSLPRSSLAIVVVGEGQLEVTAVYVHAMIIHHIQNNTDASIVQRLHHLLEFTYSHLGSPCIGTVTPLWHIVVQGIISPVVLRFLRLGLVHGKVVVTGQYLHGIHAQGLQVPDIVRFCKGQKLAWITAPAGWMYTEIAMMHLVHNHVRCILQLGAHVLVPTLGICVFHPYNSSTLSVYAYSLGKGTWTFTTTYIEGIEMPCPVALQAYTPTVQAIAFHLQYMQGFLCICTLVYPYSHGTYTAGRIQIEHTLFLAVLQFVKLMLGKHIHAKYQKY